MDNVQEDMKTKISFPTTFDHHTKQHRVETSGSSLIVMMEDRKDGLDKSKTCCLHGPWPSKPIDQTGNYFCICERVLLFATVFDDSVTYAVLSASRSSLLSLFPIKRSH